MGKILFRMCCSVLCLLISGSAVSAHGLFTARAPADDFPVSPPAAAQTLTVIFGELDPFEALGEPAVAGEETSGAAVFTAFAAAPLMDTDAPAVPALAAPQVAAQPATAVPEPAGLVLFGLGLLGLFSVIRRRSKKRNSLFL